MMGSDEDIGVRVNYKGESSRANEMMPKCSIIPKYFIDFQELVLSKFAMLENKLDMLDIALQKRKNGKMKKK